MLRGSETYKILVIGGSSGGLEAFLTILTGLNEGFKLPVVFVLHQQRKAKSLLQTVLSANTYLMVKEPSDKEKIMPGHIYVAPPDYHLLIEADGTFSYSYSEPINFSRPSIDMLFETAAESFGSATAGLLLTGANHDGASGLCSIRHKGGLAIVQDPETAKSPEMPRAAVKMGCIENVLNLIDIPLILNTINKKYIAHYKDA